MASQDFTHLAHVLQQRGGSLGVLTDMLAKSYPFVDSEKIQEHFVAMTYKNATFIKNRRQLEDLQSGIQT